MQTVTSANFSLSIAYVIPGFVTLLGLRWHSDVVRSWLGNQSAASPTVGGFLYVTLASIGVGLFVNGLRWLTLDQIHVRTGLPKMDWSYADLQKHYLAYEFLINNQFRYHQFNGNMLISVAFYWASGCGAFGWPGWWSLLGFLAIESVFLLISRDTYGNFIRRSRQLLGKSGSTLWTRE